MRQIQWLRLSSSHRIEFYGVSATRRRGGCRLCVDLWVRIWPARLLRPLLACSCTSEQLEATPVTLRRAPSPPERLQWLGELIGRSVFGTVGKHALRKFQTNENCKLRVSGDAVSCCAEWTALINARPIPDWSGNHSFYRMRSDHLGERPERHRGHRERHRGEHA